jgi:hypothetical protein
MGNDFASTHNVDDFANACNRDDFASAPGMILVVLDIGQESAYTCKL